MQFISDYISDLREQRRFNVKRDIEEESRRRYSIIEFNGSLFYAFDNVPTVAIPSDTMAGEIRERLHSLQDNYVTYRLRTRNHECDSIQW